MWDAAYKEEFATRCGIKFPCQKTCREDFGQACPTGWAFVDGVCVAIPTAEFPYSGPCVPFADLSNLTKQDKQIFGELCAVDFCESVPSPAPDAICEPDETEVCALDWLHVGSLIGHCHAPSYQGPCRPLISVSDLEAIGKETYAEKCGVKWSCKKGDSALRTKSIQVNATTEPYFPSGPLAGDGRIFVVS